MSSPEPNLTKLSREELEELYERQRNLLKNKKLLAQLPDKGKQLEEKLKKVKNELDLRNDIDKLDGGMKALSVDCEVTDVLKEKHVQYVCHLEKSPQKERYKPFSTLVPNPKKKTENPTQLITLTESIVLLAEQANKLPVEKVKKAIEGTEMQEKDDPEDLESEH